jgi:hypothetical protein
MAGEDEVALTAEDPASAVFKQFGTDGRDCPRVSACRVALLSGQDLAAGEGVIRWRWRPAADPDCHIGCWPPVGDACRCLLKLIANELRLALAAGEAPDVGRVNSFIALALGRDRPGVVELRTPACPDWLPALH